MMDCVIWWKLVSSGGRCVRGQEACLRREQLCCYSRSVSNLQLLGGEGGGIQPLLQQPRWTYRRSRYKVTVEQLVPRSRVVPLPINLPAEQWSLITTSPSRTMIVSSTFRPAGQRSSASTSDHKGMVTR